MEIQCPHICHLVQIKISIAPNSVWVERAYSYLEMVCQKRREDGHWKSKAFNFLVVLRIPVKECLQYDNKIEMLTS